MTELQKNQIHKMRKQFVSYSEIAREIGLPANTIKSYCYRHGLHTTQLLLERRLCLCCGKPLPPQKTRPLMYCSSKCRVKYWRAHRSNDTDMIVETRCVVCGKTIYDYESAHRKYCSRECFESRGNIINQ